jgi:hypothetical protein
MPCSVCYNMQLFEGCWDRGTNMLATQLAQPSRRVQCIRVNKELQRHQTTPSPAAGQPCSRYALGNLVQVYVYLTEYRLPSRVTSRSLSRRLNSALRVHVSSSLPSPCNAPTLSSRVGVRTSRLQQTQESTHTRNGC